VSCHYDYNQNELPTNEKENASQQRDKSEHGDFELKLSLHIECEWNDKSMSPTKSSPRCDSGGRSPAVSDLYEDSDATTTGTPETPHRYIRSLYILKDFKQNYPKFIQYSDFSPKVTCKRPPQKWPFTPKRCKRGSVYPGKNRSEIRYSRKRSTDNGGYRRYSEVTSDFPLLPPLVHKSRRSKLTSLAGNLNCEMTPLKASTPTDEKENGEPAAFPLLTSNTTSLEEFELLESLFDTK
jgi:hypothetical protein